MHLIEERPMVMSLPETLGRKIGIEARARRGCGGEEKPNWEEGSGVRYACPEVSKLSSKAYQTI